MPGRRADLLEIKSVWSTNNGVVELEASREHRLRTDVVVYFRQCVMLDTVQRRAEIKFACVTVNRAIWQGESIQIRPDRRVDVDRAASENALSCCQRQRIG